MADRTSVLHPSDCPRTQAAQDASWAKHGNDNDYMRMIEAYAFACSLEREVTALRKQLRQAARDAADDARSAATEARWQDRNDADGVPHGSY